MTVIVQFYLHAIAKVMPVQILLPIEGLRARVKTLILMSAGSWLQDVKIKQL